MTRFSDLFQSVVGAEVSSSKFCLVGRGLGESRGRRKDIAGKEKPGYSHDRVAGKCEGVSPNNNRGYSHSQLDRRDRFVIELKREANERTHTHGLLVSLSCLVSVLRRVKTDGVLQC